MNELNSICFFLGDPTHFQQLVEVALSDLLASLNLAVHQRLSEGGLILLVMATQSVAIHVDDDIAMELLTEIHRQSNDLSDGFGIFTVHMEDWNLQHLGDVCRVRCRASL